MPFFYRLAYLFLLNYWYWFRPHTRGVHCLITCKKRILLIRHTYGLDYWELPGGGLRPGETALEAIRREVLEEVGLSPVRFYPLGRYSTSHEYKIDLCDAYIATVNNQKYHLTSPEIATARWFLLKKLPTHLSPHVQNTFVLYRKHIN